MDDPPNFGGARRYSEPNDGFFTPFSRTKGNGSTQTISSEHAEQVTPQTMPGKKVRCLKISLILLAVLVVAIVVTVVVITQTSTGSDDDSSSKSNRSALPDVVTESGKEYLLTMEPEEFTRFYIDLEKPSDVEVQLQVSDDDGDVTMAVYARLGEEPNHILYDDMQRILESTATRRKRALAGRVLSARFLALTAGRWFFALFNGGQDSLSTAGTIDFEEAVCAEDCSGHGTCNAGRCECEGDWFGQDCSYRTECPPVRCSSHGSPNGDVCVCDDGWTGELCEEMIVPPTTTKTMNIQTTEEPPATCPPMRCSSHGKLQPNGTCLCDKGWSGQLCEEDEEKECPSLKCSSHGTPNGDVCECDEGWTGELCEEMIVPSTTTRATTIETTKEPPATCPPLRCSSHGKLQPSGTCLCDEGWSGQLCEEGVGCLLKCSSHGTVDGNVCKCEEGWSGEFCENTDGSNTGCATVTTDSSTVATVSDCPQLKCSLHGTLEAGVCQCDTGWTGHFCENEILTSTMATVLSTTATETTRFTTKSADGITCPTGTTAVPTDAPVTNVASGTFLQLQIPPGGTSYLRFTLELTSDVTLQFSSTLDESVRLAIYAKRGDEKPDFAWYDITKRVTVPTQAGSTEVLKYMQSGQWIMALYNGGDDTLDVSVSFRFPVSPVRCPEDCNGRGTCDNGICECTLGWGGAACAEVDAAPCIPNNCTVNGRFVNGTCYCYRGWKGEYCEEVDCIPSNCNGNGQCVDGQCHCNEGWKGNVCDEADCIPADCNGRGRCKNANCICNQGWQGNTCNITYSTCPGNCSSHGSCDYVTGLCTCEAKWTDNNCATLLCDDCSEYGTCDNGTCFCDEGWTDFSCRTRTCPDLCDVHGTCNNGTCLCDAGYAGSLCSLVGCPRNCSENGRCEQYGTGWTCVCESAFQGEDCSYGTESTCDDGLDNDKDGITDCDDPDCCAQVECFASDQCRLGEPEPEDLAQTNTSATQSFADQVRFLFESGLFQFDLNVSTLLDERLCVLRGRVVTQQLVPLPSVNISVISKPQFGYTVSRHDGKYDLVLNCGGRETIRFDRQQFITSQRTVDTVVWKYIETEEVALIPIDTKFTELDLRSNETLLAEGAESLDEDGKRTASLILNRGTSVRVRDVTTGNETEMNTVNMRITEFTVGRQGIAAMPAELPPLVGYTYCAEISIDEATVDGTTEVYFNRPVAFYVDNYLNFPVGTAVPVGFYNRTLGEWVASKNGRVVKVLDDYNLDVTGTNSAASEADRLELEITDDELEKLKSSSYMAGQTLWRATITHLTPYDCNFPYGPPEDGCSPAECNDLPDPDDCNKGGGGGGKGNSRRKRRSVPAESSARRQQESFSNGRAAVRRLMASDDGVDRARQDDNLISVRDSAVVYHGSELKPQKVYESWEGIHDYSDDSEATCAPSGEKCGDIYPYDNHLQSPDQMQLGIAGTQLRLHYNYFRQSGYKPVLNIPVSGPDLPESVKAIVVEIQVAGVTHKEVLPPQKDLTYTFVWDRLDAYGREVHGRTKAVVKIGYEYQLVYYGVPSQFTASFNRFSNADISTRVSRATQTAVFYIDKEAQLLGSELQDVGLAGWSLSVQHSYDAVADIVYKGTGEKYQAKNENEVRTLIGTGETATNCQACGEGDGLEARLTSPVAVARAIDGDLFVVDHRYIRRYNSKGTVSTVASLSWNPRYRTYMAVNPRDGFILLTDPDNYKIHQINPETGETVPFAGTGVKCAAWDNQCGDGGLAIDATFSNPKGIAVGKDGSIFVVDGRRIRQIGSDGIIENYLGSNRRMDRTLEKPSDRYKLGLGQAFLTRPTAITVDPRDESLYIVDGKILLKLTREGRLKIAAGIAPEATQGSYEPPTETNIPTQTEFKAPLSSVALGPDGKVYLAETDFDHVNKIHRIDPGGTISHISGTETTCACRTSSCSCYAGDGEVPANARFWAPVALSVSANGQLVIADLGNRRVRSTKVRGEDTIAAVDEYVVPDTSQTRVHVFSSKGFHLRTVNLLTKATEYEFHYTEDDKLKTVVDRFNRTLQVERRSDGRLHAFVAPRGQRSIVTLDDNGMLTSLMDEKGISAHFTYDEDGLVVEHVPPVGCPQSYEYNEYGRLTAIDRGQNVRQQFQEVQGSESAEETVQTYTSLTGRLHVQRQHYQGNLLTTTKAIGPVQDISVYDSLQEELITYKPNGMQLRFGYMPSAIWSFPVPAYYKLTTPVSGQEILTEFEQRATFADVRDPLTVTSLTKEIRKNGMLTSSREEDFVGRQADVYYFKKDGTKYLAARQLFDTDGRLVFNSFPESPVADTVITYNDDQGTVVQERDGMQARTLFNEAGQTVQEIGYDGLFITYTYDSNNQVSSMALPSGRTYHFLYDDCGALSSIEMPSGSVHYLKTTLSKYQRHEIYQSATDAPYSLETIYNLDGQLRKESHASSSSTDFTYDEAFRPTSVSYGNTVIVFDYLQGAVDPAYIYRYENKELDSVIGIERDGMLVTSLKLQLSADSTDNDAEFQYEHDENFFVSSTRASVFDDSFSLNMVTDTYGTVLQSGTFNIEESEGVQITDGTFSCDYVYSPHGLIVSQRCSIAGEIVFELSLSTETNATSVTSRTIKIGEAGPVTYKYNYDVDGQLITVDENGVTSESYVYDINGNRASWTSAGQTHSATYDDDDHIITVDGEAYEHSQDGFLWKTPSGELVYNSRGELREYISSDGNSVRYRYDGLHRLIERKRGDDVISYIYGDASSPVKLSHYVVNGDVYALHYDHRGFPLAVQVNEQWYYIACDHIGTPLAIFNSQGELEKQMIYSSFGELLVDRNPDFYFPIGFAGGIADPVSGLVHFLFRDYSPAIGQWTARDPSLFSSYQPNLYQYVFNDPINLRDPLGLWCFSISFRLGIQLGGKLCMDSNGRFTACGEGGVSTPGAPSIGFDPLGSPNKRNGGSLTAYGEGSADVGGLISGSVGGEYEIFGGGKWRWPNDPCAWKAEVKGSLTNPLNGVKTSASGSWSGKKAGSWSNWKDGFDSNVGIEQGASLDGSSPLDNIFDNKGDFKRGAGAKAGVRYCYTGG